MSRQFLFSKYSPLSKYSIISVLQELIFSDEDKEKSVETILKKYNPNTEILIIEIYPQKINERFLKPLNIYNCSICNKKIDDINKAKDL